MKWESKRGATVVSLALILCLCGVPEMMAQRQSPAAPPSQTTTQTQQLLPDAPSASSAPQSNGNTAQNQNQGQKPPAQAPAGTGAAEAGPTAGGAGSKPAGMAIAPAKQHQVRSFLIKLGAIAGGAVAIGTVYALSRSSPSRPPGAK